MMNANRSPMPALLLALAVSACGSSSGGSAADVGDSGTQETRQGACTGLSQAGCEASDRCEPYLARLPESACPYPEVPMPHGYFGCHELLTCSQAATWAHPADSPDDWHLFNDMCIPEGWVAGDWDEACGSGCQGLAQADCEAADHCFPVSGAPLLDGCIWGESEYAGCWTSEKLDDGEVVAILCTGAVTWAHPADAPEKWYVFVDGCVPDGWVTSEADPCEPACPKIHPWLKKPQSWKCDLPAGTVCTWPAEACEAGQKPDNVCTCVDHFGKLWFECERPFHNCLPLEGSDVPGGTLTRPEPMHREVAEACEFTLEPRPNPTCIPSYPEGGDPQSECMADAECKGDGARCLDEWQGMGETLCTCHVPECSEDTDCPNKAVCKCGKTENVLATYCEGPTGKPCLHKCLPSDCWTDADCGEGKLCSPSWDICGWQMVGYHCHDPAAVECFSKWECMGENWGCNFEKGKGWLCQGIPMCD